MMLCSGVPLLLHINCLLLGKASESVSLKPAWHWQPLQQCGRLGALGGTSGA